MSDKSLIKIPSLRLGRTDLSGETEVLRDCRTNDPLAELRYVEEDDLFQELASLKDRRDEIFKRYPTETLHRAMRNAADFFLNAALPLHDGPGESAILQKPEDYVICLSATSGLPPAQVRLAMEEIGDFLKRLPDLAGFLMNGLPAKAFDGQPLESSWGREYLVLNQHSHYSGELLTGHHPSENLRWLHALALRVPVLVEPREWDVWTPLRLAQALMSAGVPPEALNVCCTTPDEDFGSSWSVMDICKTPLIVCEDSLEDWATSLPLMERCVMRHAGRSQLSTGLIVTPRRAEDVAYGLAQRLVKIPSETWTEPGAQIAATPTTEDAGALTERFKEYCEDLEARDITESIRKSGVHEQHQGLDLLLPTVLLLPEEPEELPDPPSFPFPCVLVTQLSQSRMPRLGEVYEINRAYVLTERRETLESFARSPGLPQVLSSNTASAESHLPALCDRNYPANLFSKQIIL
jgi:hypothetical protein